MLLSIIVSGNDSSYRLINFESESDFDYFFDGVNDGPDYQKGYDKSNQSLKLAEANCANSSWTCAYVKGKGQLQFTWANEPSSSHLFNLVVTLDDKELASINCIPFQNWQASKSIRIHNSDSDLHKLIFELKLKDLPINTNCNPKYLFSNAWIDNIKTTGSLQFVIRGICPGIIKESDDNSSIINSLMVCDEFKLDAGVRLQRIIDLIEQFQKMGYQGSKVLIIQGGAYEGPLEIVNIRDVTFKKSDEIGEIMLSGIDTSIKIKNSSNIIIKNLNFGKSNENGLLIIDSNNCIIENNKITGFNYSGVKVINSTYNTIKNNIIKSGRNEVDGIYLTNSSSNDIMSNIIEIDNYIYILTNDSYDNKIFHIYNEKGLAIKDHSLIFGIEDSGFIRKNELGQISGYDPNEESSNEWHVV